MNTNSLFGGNHEVIGKTVKVVAKYSFSDQSLVACTVIGEAQEKHPNMRSSITKDLFAEVLVISDQNPLLLVREVNDSVVVGLGHHLCHADHIVALSSQVMHNRLASGFVDQKPAHQATSTSRG